MAIVLLLFGGARLAGLGKSTGRAIKEFKEETKGIGGNDDAENVTPPPAAPAPPASTYQQPPDSTSDAAAPRSPLNRLIALH